MKIPKINGVLTIYGDQDEARHREYNIGTSHKLMHDVGSDEAKEERRE
jgi:hypothetical protein